MATKINSLKIGNGETYEFTLPTEEAQVYQQGYRWAVGNDNDVIGKYFKFLSMKTGEVLPGYGNLCFVFGVGYTYQNSSFSLLYINLRSNNPALAVWDARYLCRDNIFAENNIAYTSTAEGIEFYIKGYNAQYGRLVINLLYSGGLNGEHVPQEMLDKLIVKSSSPTDPAPEFQGYARDSHIAYIDKSNYFTQNEMIITSENTTKLNITGNTELVHTTDMGNGESNFRIYTNATNMRLCDSKVDVNLSDLQKKARYENNVIIFD